METRKWLKRKYPDSFNELDEYFNDLEIEHFKQSTNKIGRLTRDFAKYKKGTIIQFRRSNPINDFNYPLVYAIAKCELGYTASGYHSFDIHESYFEELKS